jgi:4-hydroxy-tetrahydrodipicolinate synthase
MLGSTDLRGRLIPAVPVPFDAEGRVHSLGQERYAAYLAAEPIGGVAVWAHTGRGLWLSERQRAEVLGVWRRSLGPGQVLIAAAGAARTESEPARVEAQARVMARQAGDLGAEALLVYPPAGYRDRPDRDERILGYHEAIATEGLPLILFYLYEDAGGVAYSADVVIRLLNLEAVIGVKVATLDSVMTFQDLAVLIRERAPGTCLITGEDRFLGYSLSCGAEAALVGMGAVGPALQAELIKAHRQGDASRFLSLQSSIDDLGRNVFCHPMEGYIGRLMACLVAQGILPAVAAHDPWGPTLRSDEPATLRACLARLGLVAV